MKQSLKLAAALAALLASGSASAQKLIPVEDFVKHPTYSSVKISPNGEYLAMTVDRGEQDLLTVLRTSDLSIIKVNQLPDEKSVGSFYWTSPNRLLFNSVKKIGSYARPAGTGEWYAVNADGSQPRPLIFYGTRDATQRGKTVGAESFSLVDTLKNDDVNVVMEANYQRSSSGAGAELVLMDTLSGRRKSLARAPRDNCEIALDPAKEPRFAVCYDTQDEEGNYSDSHNELYRRDAAGKWSLVNSSKASGKRIRIISSAADGTVYATQGDGKVPDAFGTLDTETGAFNKLFQDPVSEVAGLIRSADGENVIGAMTMAGAPQVSLLDEQHPDAEIYASLASAFPGQYVSFSSATQDGKKIVVSVSSDSNPGELYLYDRDTGKARYLMHSRRWLDAKDMGTIKSVSFTTRDGLKIHGYLTLPKGSDARNLPMIVNVHGGPMGPRDTWGFSTENQMFANRGYAVLQINYRGSGGFGKAFEEMAYGQWAEGIMNDIIDGTRWAINQGYADKDRICIYGGSFGGYASLMAPAREPSLFKCALGYVGLYDAQIQFTKSDTSKREDGLRYLNRAFGGTRAEQDAMSPINHVDKIRIPVMLVAGARDARCPPEHTEAMAKALTRAGNPPVDVIIASGEGHGFYKEENNLNFYSKALDFFAKNIGGKGAR
jgi:dipeptidyl aminopeptidase/acylaminoacyl peptidase